MSLEELVIEKVFEKDPDFFEEVKNELKEKIKDSIQQINFNRLEDYLVKSAIDAVDMEDLMNADDVCNAFINKIKRDLDKL